MAKKRLIVGKWLFQVRAQVEADDDTFGYRVEIHVVASNADEAIKKSRSHLEAQERVMDVKAVAPVEIL
jgi:hypothetical protein